MNGLSSLIELSNIDSVYESLISPNDDLGNPLTNLGLSPPILIIPALFASFKVFNSFLKKFGSIALVVLINSELEILKS
ncbi:hypothetical protein WICMUC_001279 [Wickerhamomyces mucosus]|uniref:Uncharacterized protein n=1 Tax=Wickerhamomyces mucosus TaxID=1378264 RepID=A0A9P8TGV3_9ASCO|nr:hypothetical protein WICMUC_001279 [Wickerhamomyces mucosus]